MARITFRTTRQNHYWLRVASCAGFSNSRVINALIEPGQHGGVQMTVEWLIRGKIQRLSADARNDYEVLRLERLLQEATQ